MSIAGPHSPSSVTSVLELLTSTVPWSNPGNATASDNSYATATLAPGDLTYALRCTDFGFTTSDIPSGATIEGFFVEVEASQDGDAVQYASNVVFGGSSQTAPGDEYNIGVAAGNFGFTPTGTDTYWPLGGPTDQGPGRTWDQVIDPSFGLDLYFTVDPSGAGSTVSVDHVRMTVYYSGGGPLEAIGAARGTSTATGTGSSVVRASASSSGSSAVAAVALAVALTAGSIAGSSTATATGTPLVTSPATGTATGTATASAVATSVAASSGSSTGTATASATGRVIGAGVGSVAGTSTVTATATEIAGAAGTSAGASTAAASGRSTAGASGSSAGLASASAVGGAVVAASGSAAGLAACVGIGNATSVAPPERTISAEARERLVTVPAVTRTVTARG